jgi:methionyl-tRNA formyltransferase
MTNEPQNIYVSMTRDGYYALELLLKNKKRIDEIISLPKGKSSNVCDYINFEPLVKKFGVKITYTENVNKLSGMFRQNRPNVIIANGWSQLLRKELLDTAVNGCVGTHPALLPKNRGRAPVPWHFINKEKYGGVTLFYLEAACDSGPIIDQAKFKIRDNDNASSYYQKITNLGAKLLLKHFDSIVNGSAKSKARPQDHLRATYLLKRRPIDSEIDFSAKSAKEIHNMVRAVSDIYPLVNFNYKKQKFLILKSSLPTHAPRFSGIPGQIAKITKDYIWILGKSGIIEFNTILNDKREKVKPNEVFRAGDVLNE